MDEEFEKEEIIFCMDFTSKIQNDFKDDDFKLLGVDTDSPILQLGNQVFQGEWKEVLGTALMFEEDNTRSMKEEQVFVEQPSKYYNLAYKTDKLLNMSRVFVKPKIDPKDQPSTSGNENDILKI